jgi:catechol 2,3-dioxygenase-like lactoylglutathione lyase family enzyme
VQPLGILEASLYADDLEAARRFYGGVLGLTLHSEHSGRHVFFRCGAGMLLIFDPGATSNEETFVAGALIPLHGATGPGHVALAVRECELEGWRGRLKQHGVGVESEVSWPGGGHSVYFRDPAGNSVELATPALWGLPEG